MEEFRRAFRSDEVDVETNGVRTEIDDREAQELPRSSHPVLHLVLHFFRTSDGDLVLPRLRVLSVSAGLVTFHLLMFGRKSFSHGERVYKPARTTSREKKWESIL